MFTTIAFINNELQANEHNNVSEAITFISNKMDLKETITAQIEKDENLIAIVNREDNVTIVKVYNSKLVTNNLNLSLSTPIKFELMTKNNNNF